MNTTIDLKAEVSKAVGAQWDAFAAAHPRLAAELGQDVLIEQALAALSDDAAYRQAMQSAADAGALAESASEIIASCVRALLHALTSAT